MWPSNYIENDILINFLKIFLLTVNHNPWHPKNEIKDEGGILNRKSETVTGIEMQNHLAHGGAQ